MTRSNFIFSNATKHKLSRHLAFWLIFSLHFIIQNLLIGGPGEANTYRSFLDSSVHLLYFIPFYILSTYFLIYFLLPKFFYPQKWIEFIFSFLALYLIHFIIIYYAGVLYLHHTTNQLLEDISFQANKYHAIVDGLFVPFMLYGITLGIVLSKKWFLQHRENEKLSKQKLATELQLLKTSIHPRFLFHALQTVKLHIHQSSSHAPALILQLSELLSYILYEKDQTWVPLEKELEIVRSYIQLEEKGFGKKLTSKKEFNGNPGGKYIVPFILLSIIEGGFEYIYQSGQEKPIIRLISNIKETTIHFQLFFSRPTDEAAISMHPEEKFISLQMQMQSQYAGLHHLEISNKGEVISIDLKLPLYSSDVLTIHKDPAISEVPHLSAI
jgi:two-component system LytT family sensor kinase